MAVSTARQESFGIAMQEAVALGAWAVVPNRAAYPDVTRPGSGFIYDSLEDAAELVQRCLTANASPVWDGYYENVVQRIGEEIKRRFYNGGG